MPRLLSRKEPTKIVPREPKAPLRDNTISEVKKIIKPTVQKSFSPPKPKTEDEMTAWEYYNSLMVFGKRKMTRIEWVIWKNKKDYEDMRKGKFVYGDPPLRKKISFAEYNWRVKKDPDFVDFVAEEEFSL